MATTRRTLNEWQHLVSEMDSSGQPQRQWCADNNVNYHSIKEAKARLAKSGAGKTQGADPDDGPGWVRLKTPPPNLTKGENGLDRLEVSFGQIKVIVEVTA